MKHWGNVRSKSDAVKQCGVIAKETGNTCVVEKAKCQDYGSRVHKKSIYVCYRLWEDRGDNSKRVMDIKAWQAEKTSEEWKWHKHI